MTTICIKDDNLLRRRSAHGPFKLVKVLPRVQLHPRPSPRLVILPAVRFTCPVVPSEIRRPGLDRRAKLALPDQHAKVPRKVARIVRPLGPLQTALPLAVHPLAGDHLLRRILAQVPVLLQHPFDRPCPVPKDADGLVAPRNSAGVVFSDPLLLPRGDVFLRDGLRLLLTTTTFGVPALCGRFLRHLGLCRDQL